MALVTTADGVSAPTAKQGRLAIDNRHDSLFIITRVSDDGSVLGVNLGNGAAISISNAVSYRVLPFGTKYQIEQVND